jgi:hypothetical protein
MTEQQILLYGTFLGIGLAFLGYHLVYFYELSKIQKRSGIAISKPLQSLLMYNMYAIMAVVGIASVFLFIS